MRPPRGGVVVFHQHNGEFHFGKSEVAGDVGSPFQAFGPALARRGLAVLAPDALTFEDRRDPIHGVKPDYFDGIRHYNALAYRLLAGDTLMRKVLDDAQRAVSVLTDAATLEGRSIGIAGYSYGGYTALYHAARDANAVVAKVGGDFITSRRVDRGHALDQERFDAIIAWLVARSAAE